MMMRSLEAAEFKVRNWPGEQLALGRFRRSASEGEGEAEGPLAIAIGR
tara:strand:+ start:380 stop:523 length:144 start_codon:yes stop_codon:yes gene_type:complete